MVDNARYLVLSQNSNHGVIVSSPESNWSVGFVTHKKELCDLCVNTCSAQKLVCQTQAYCLHIGWGGYLPSQKCVGGPLNKDTS